MDRRTVIGIALTLLLCSSGVGAAAELPALQTGDVESDTVVLEAAVEENGDARWSIEYRVALDDENTTEAFESLQRDIEQNTSDYRTQFASRMRNTVAAAENATGREMAVENVTVKASTSPLSGEYGVVRYSFDWVGFAEVSDDRIAAGDAIAGIFLDADTRLTLSWPEGYVIDVVDPRPDSEGDRSATWNGPQEFDVGQPRLVVRPANSLPPWGPVVGVLLFAGAGAVWYYRRRTGRPPGEMADESGSGGGSPAAGQSEQPAAESPSASSPTAEESAGEGAPASAEQTAAGEDATGALGPNAGKETPEELLSPEERVLGLLEQQGGRMKQKTVTEELDWSAARTSQVVGSLRDEGKVESFRLGRENVLKFPETDEPE
ncbi:helix-turn-helix transcriptional regulator [Halolamina salifodinae]|uniref:DUF4897 domain-containing protein n=1 Tax=Halolamina salifodinae TaxID=1202767 RepID=A0A8T4GZ79_9EURY|nr:hypothetical protein [Halolamina salifodinae]MBP1988327.1 hypothetical protein [Halolamina salifodinae]